MSTEAMKKPTPKAVTVVQPSKAQPKPTPVTLPFWEGTERGELQLQRCTACDRAFFYPRTICPECASDDVEWFRASGRAILYSYVIEHRPAPGFADEVPYVVALVKLEEGPIMMSNIVGVEPVPENLPLDLELTVDFADRGKYKIPVFRPETTERLTS